MSNIALNTQVLTSSNIYDQIKEIEKRVEDGELNPLEIKVFSKFLSMFAKKIDSSSLIIEGAIKEVDRNGKDNICLGAETRIQETGIKYDYSDSPAWLYINNEIAELKDLLKDIESIAKVTKAQSSWIHPVTGEELAVKPAVKKSTTSVIVSLAKK